MTLQDRRGMWRGCAEECTRTGVAVDADEAEREGEDGSDVEPEGGKARAREASSLASRRFQLRRAPCEARCRESETDAPRAKLP